MSTPPAPPYVESLAPVLWPGASAGLCGASSSPSPGPQGWEYLVLPGRHSPRLLLPLVPRAAAAGAIRRFGERTSLRSRLRNDAVALTLRCGLGQLLLRDRFTVEHVTDAGRTIEAHLREVLGDVVLGISVGKPRANRKPVIQVLDRAGRTVGFAKVGVDELTRALVAAERDALVALAAGAPGLAVTRVPRVLYSGVWEGLEVLVQSPLTRDPLRGRPDARRLRAAMREVAAVEGMRRGDLVASDYWRRLRRGVRALDGPVAGPLDEACRAFELAEHGRTVTFGAWHGDWTPWNMTYARGRVLVWDWERFERDVPLGFDALHCALQDALVRRRLDPLRAAGECVDTSGATLRDFGIGPRQARAIALVYLLSIAARYTADGQEAAGARLGRVQDWLLPALLPRMSAERSEKDGR